MKRLVDAKETGCCVGGPSTSSTAGGCSGACGKSNCKGGNGVADGGGAFAGRLPSSVVSAWKRCASGRGDANDAGALRDAIQAEIKSWVINRGAGETPLHRAARLGYYVSQLSVCDDEKSLLGIATSFFLSFLVLKR